MKLGEDRFTYDVAYSDHQVRFSLQRLPQALPKGLQLRDGEQFVMRTFDESGLRFVLLFDQGTNGFLWVLDPSVKVSDTFRDLGGNAVAGRRTGFVFFVDEELGGRKTLGCVRKASVEANDHYDGPFDQLADNYVGRTRIAEYLVRWRPGLKGKIDAYGYYLDDQPERRVAITCYGTYRELSEAGAFISRGRRSGDVYRFISLRGG
jgi:hypothetical protein